MDELSDSWKIEILIKAFRNFNLRKYFPICQLSQAEFINRFSVDLKKKYYIGGTFIKLMVISFIIEMSKNLFFHYT